MSHLGLTGLVPNVLFTSTIGTAPDAQMQARALVLRYGWNSTSYQILNPGMALWFASDGDAVIGYVSAGGYRVVAGGPVCASERLAEVVWAFELDARRTRQRVCYFGAQDRLVHVLESQGPVARLLLGAQPVWHPQHWQGRVVSKASLRGQIARARNKQVAVNRLSVDAANHLPGLKRCLHAWLTSRGLPPLSFLVESQTLEALNDRRVFVATWGGDVVGFLVASPVALRNGWLIEQIVRCGGAPNGTVELLLDAAMRDIAQTSAEYVTLGLAPLSRRAGIPQPPQPLWVYVVLALIRTHGQRFFNFDGLDTFKAKFLPDYWEPIYAVTNERQVSIRTLYAIIGAFGRRAPVLFIGYALIRAALQETKWFTGWLSERFAKRFAKWTQQRLKG